MRFPWALAILVMAACSGGSGGAALDEPCGGPDDIRCADGHYCQMQYNTCGDEMGVCSHGGLCDSTASPT